MIHAFGEPHPPVPRLIAALAARGHEIRTGDSSRPTERAIMVLGPGLSLDAMALGVLLGAWRTAPGARVLTLSLIGAHPDARAKRLKQMWNVEERARGSGIPSLTLRLAPMVGPESPLWLRLRSKPRLPKGGRQLLNPVCEDDVVDTIDRALSGNVVWDGCYEVAGAEPITLAELAAMAEATGSPLSRDAGAWEPPLDEMAEHRLCESEAWRDHFGITPQSVSARAPEWIA